MLIEFAHKWGVMVLKTTPRFYDLLELMGLSEELYLQL